nr:hypothetical protein [Euzebya pacifica]
MRSPTWPSGGGGSAGGLVVGGEGQEDLVEGGAAQLDVEQLHRCGVQRTDRGDQLGGAVGDGHDDLAGVDVGPGGLHGDSGQGGGRILGPGRVGDAKLDDVTAEGRLQLVGGALGDQRPVVDHGDAVGQLVGLLQVLGGQQQGGSVAHELGDQLPQLDARPRVQAGGRLVQEQHTRTADEAGRQVEASPHATGVGLDGAGRCLGQADALQHLVGASGSFCLAQAVEPADHDEVLPTGQVAVDRGVLPGQADLAAQGLRLLHHVEPRDRRAAAGGLQQGREDADEGGLPGAVGAEQPEDGALGNLEVDTPQGVDVAEGLGDSLDADDGFWHDDAPGRQRTTSSHAATVLEVCNH